MLTRGGSGISAYKIGQNYIIVQFSDGATYVYDCQSTSVEHVEEMKVLAQMGEGLNSYIKGVVNKC